MTVFRLTLGASAVLLVLACENSITAITPVEDPEEMCEVEEECEVHTVILSVLRIANTYLTNALEIWDEKKGYDCVIAGETEFAWPPETTWWSISNDVFICTKCIPPNTFKAAVLEASKLGRRTIDVNLADLGEPVQLQR